MLSSKAAGNLLAVCACAVAIALAGCGGGSSDTTESTAAPARGGSLLKPALTPQEQIEKERAAEGHSEELSKEKGLTSTESEES